MMAIGMIPNGINLRPHENMIYSVILKQIFLNHLLLFGSSLCMLDPIITRGNTKDSVEGSIE
jgi:hypothetical protein